MEREERVLGALFGVACGDALGATLEFTSEREGKRIYGYHKEIIGGGVMKVKPGDVTDDTKMTIAVAEGIIENPEVPIKSIGEKFVAWYSTKPRDIGLTCRYAISKYLECGNWNEASQYVHINSGGRTAGNGTLMRCIPAALYYSDYNKMVRITREQSKMTHYDEKASEACALYNTIVYKFLKGEDKEEVVTETLKGYEEYANIQGIGKEMLNPSGYVVDTFQCALWCFLNNSNIEDIICEAVNLYGDPDTIGAIAGGLAGVYYGYNSIPERWRNKLLIKDKLTSIGERISNN